MIDRAQRAAEAILTDPSLTDKLDDEPARVLIDWAVETAKQVADHTTSMDDETALAYIEDEMVGVRKILRRINKLYDVSDELSSEEIGGWLQTIYDMANGVAAVEARPVPNPHVIAEAVKKLPPSDGIRQITGQFVLLGAVRDEYDGEQGLDAGEVFDALDTEDGVKPSNDPIDASPAGDT